MRCLPGPETLQIAQHDADALGLRIVDVSELAHAVREILHRTSLGDFHVAVMGELAGQYLRYVTGESESSWMRADRAHPLWRLHDVQVPRKQPRRDRDEPFAPGAGDRR